MNLNPKEHDALYNTMHFLCELVASSKSSKVPKEVILKAAECLEYYPSTDTLHKLRMNTTLYSKIPKRY
jgi:hypothetical protein